MANFSLRSTVSGLLPDAFRDQLRPIGYRMLGMMSSGKLTKAIQGCRASGRPVKIVLGAGSSSYEGWIPTDVYILDIRSSEQWAMYFEPGSIDAMMCEHVLEHLSEDENRAALSSAFAHLKSGARFRIAVPDGNRLDAIYRADVAPPADGHKSLFSVRTLSLLLEGVGFIVRPLEYFDENEEFHAVDWNSADGHISRSIRYDRQDKFQRPGMFYTSLIVDAVKP